MIWSEYLEQRLAMVDSWRAQGKMTVSSKVIPVAQSVETKQWVMPSEQVLRYLRDARGFAVANCRCRTLAQNCSRPLETCFALNDAADIWVEQGYARRCSLEEAEAKLDAAAQAGLVPMSLFDPKHNILAICNCCPCCCHDLQYLLARGRSELVAHSEYMAIQNQDECLNCGECVDRCYFGARSLFEGVLQYDPAKCYGCGLCVAVCPAQCISMELRRLAPKESASG